MKKIIYSFFVFLFIFSAQQSFAESIERYYVDMTLNTDSSVDIVETIDYDFGVNQRHGIFRFIPVNFDVEGQEKMNGLKQRKLEFRNLAVTRDGISETYTKDSKDSNGNYYVKIGNPNKTITGTHTYKVHYTVDGSLRYFDDFDEVYWNAIGLDWEIPIKNIKVTLRGSDQSISFLNSACYVGSVGSNQSCNNTIRQGRSIQYFQQSLNPREGLTIAASINPKGVVEKNEIFGFSTKAFVSGGIALLITIILGAIYSVYKYLNKYKTYDPVYPRYEPPQDFSPVGIGYLVDKQFDGRDITAGIISLAQRGYIHIEQIKNGFFGGKDYVFTLAKTRGVEKENPFDHELLNLIFNDSKTEVKLSSLSKKNVLKSKEELRKYLNSSFVRKGFVENFFKKDNNNTIKSIAVIIGIAIFILYKFFAASSPFFMIFLFVVSFLAPFLIVLSKRYTKKGWEAKYAIEGFKDFLSMTEKDRYEFFNNPVDNPQEFMKYLPYAIALGIEKKWAKQFKNLNIKTPDWYSGVDNFNAVIFASHMSDFNSTLTKLSTVKSSRSGSGSGGFSGGGSGGGGGGSW